MLCHIYTMLGRCVPAWEGFQLNCFQIDYMALTIVGKSQFDFRSMCFVFHLPANIGTNDSSAGDAQQFNIIMATFLFVMLIGYLRGFTIA